MIDYILSQSGFFLIISLFVIGAVGSLLFYEYDRMANIWGNAFAMIGSIGGLLYASFALMRGGVQQFSFSSTFPLLTFSMRIDSLSAFFIGIISLIALLCSLYAIGYLQYFYKKYAIAPLAFFYNIFIISMILVVTANHALYFLIVWEIMALASYFLVMYERNDPDNVKAGSLYFIMTHIGTAFILSAFLVLYQAVGSFDFDDIRKFSPFISPLVRDAVFISALIGFGMKCGIIPLHIWLPAAHPAAPSHVSALMSGVMIKTGVYMIIRICFDLFSGVPEWWGLVVLVLGMISAVLGVLYALSEHDIKKLLAFHSIENIGIIFLGLGSSIIFSSAGMVGLAVLSSIAALYHTANHAIFKALLFMGAGSVLSATHTRNIEEYGGLIKRMPQTAFFFLIGSLAISAMPPFNGFVSEWLTFQSLFQGVLSLSLISKLFCILAIGALGLTGGLAAACFVKAFGVTFLARARSEHAQQANESSASMRLGMAMCALLTLVFGIGSGYISKILTSITQSFPSFSHADSFVFTSGLLSVGDGFAEMSMPRIAFGLLILFIILIIGMRVFLPRTKVLFGRTWDCGIDLTSRMEITATGFSRSLITVFRSLLFPVKKVTVDYGDTYASYFPQRNTVTLELYDVYRERLYGVIAKTIMMVSEKARGIQSGNVNMYILYILVALMALFTILVV